MANNSIAFGRLTETELTEADVHRLNRQNSLSVRSGEKGYILLGTKIYSRAILDDNNRPRYTKEGKPIRELSTICVVQRADGSLAVGKVTLTWLSGDDLFVEEKCPLLPCKDGVRKYAATWKLTRVATRDFGLDLYAGMKAFDRTIAFVGGEPIEGYKSPAFEDVWVNDPINGTINKPDLGDDIQMARIRRASLAVADASDIDDDLIEKLTRLRDSAAANIGVQK